MNKDYPKAQIILDFNLVFGILPPHNKISLIKDFSKSHILYELCALNYRLKPKNKLRIDTSLETQIKELKYFTQNDEHFKFYSTIAGKHTTSKGYFPLIFNRPACLLAIEEIINSDEIDSIGDFKMTFDVWDGIIKYLLSVNYAITKIKEEENEEGFSFENINPKLLPLNELMIETDPIFTPYRGLELFHFFLENPLTKDKLKKYFDKTYGIEPEEFVFNLLKIYVLNNYSKPEFNFYYKVKEKDQKIFDNLSWRYPTVAAHKLINVRKSPLIKVGELEYLIADNSFLLEKSYNQFINDFWFDWIKKFHEKEINIEFYRSLFGYFFEQYLEKLVNICFKNYKYAQLLTFKQLKLTTNIGDIELADVYLRYNKNILLAQVKSNSIYDKEKYGGDVESLYKNDRNNFFKTFGVNQIIDSIDKLEKNINKLDSKFPVGKTYNIYPCIIVNEKALQTTFMADTFNKRFQELLKKIKKRKALIRPLCLIHISDFERLEEPLVKNPKLIWNFLKLNHKGRKFIPPLFDTINRNWKGKEYPPRIMELYKRIITKYEEKKQPPTQ